MPFPSNDIRFAVWRGYYCKLSMPCSYPSCATVCIEQIDTRMQGFCKKRSSLFCCVGCLAAMPRLKKQRPFSSLAWLFIEKGWCSPGTYGTPSKRRRNKGVPTCRLKALLYLGSATSSLQSLQEFAIFTVVRTAQGCHGMNGWQHGFVRSHLHRELSRNKRCFEDCKRNVIVKKYFVVKTFFFFFFD